MTVPSGTTGPSEQTVSPRGQAVELVFRRALRDVLLFLGVLSVVSVVVGLIVAGLPGLWGALLGVAVAVIFSGTTVWTMLKTVDATPTMTAAVIMGGWLGKMVVLIGILAVLGRQDFYDRWVFAGVLLVGVVGSAYLDYRSVDRGRVPYVEPSAGDRSGRDDA